MSFNRPTLPTLIDRAQADIESRLPGADARLRRSNLSVLARVLAGAVHGLYGYLDWISRQILPDTSDGEFLDRQAVIWGVTRKSSAAATGEVLATGDGWGTVIPSGTVMKRADGVEYSTKAEATISVGFALIAVECAEAGQVGNATTGTVLTLVSPIAGVNSAVTVGASNLTGGSDVETDEDLRARLLARIRKPPQGGAAHDYVAWAKEVPGVTRAWVYPGELGLGTVTVRFVRDADASMIPDGFEVDAVQEHIEALRPVATQVIVLAPVAAPVNFTIQLTPNTAAVRAAVEAELRDLLARAAIPEGGNGEGIIPLSHIREAISLAAGETDHVLTVPAASVTPPTGSMATFGAITWL